MAYKPRLVDIQWAKSMMQTISDGGVLAYPAAKLIYKVSHSNHTLTLQNVDQLLDFDSYVTHQQTIEVFKVIGYSVYESKAGEGVPDKKSTTISINEIAIDKKNPRKR